MLMWIFLRRFQDKQKWYHVMYSVMEWNLSLMESNRSNGNVMGHGIDMAVP